MELRNKYGLELSSFELYVLNNITAFEYESIQGILELDTKNSFTWFLRYPKKAKDLELIKKVSTITDTPAMDLVNTFKVGYENLTPQQIDNLVEWDRINHTTLKEIVI
jgi:hypothetical protein